MAGLTDWIGTPRALAQRLTVATAGGAFFGLLGPFGSYDTPAAVRVLSWTLSFWAGALLLGAALRAAERIAGRIGTPLWFTLGAAVVLAAAALAAIVAGVFRVLRPSIRLSPPAEFYLQTLAVTAPFALGYLALARRLARAGPAAAVPPSSAAPEAGAAREPAAGPAPPPFLDRLPRALGRELIALQMEDHYVRAHTARGSDLVLLPLRDAVEELGGLEGLRVHRSWWVARDAVESARWSGRNLRLVLAGGLEAPVARGQVAALRAAGWLDGDDPAAE